MTSSTTLTVTTHSSAEFYTCTHSCLKGSSMSHLQVVRLTCFLQCLLDKAKHLHYFCFSSLHRQFFTSLLLFFFFKELFNYYLFIYLFLAVLGLHFCARAFSSCGERGPLFIAVRGPLTIAASLVAEHRLQTCRLSSCGSRA